ncbi:MAG: dihydroneopterin aldolase [Alphaproteobacteria bacterium]|nr:dihydroneopterin aldolase [Alphaproteobacteria bacterium]
MTLSVSINQLECWVNLGVYAWEQVRPRLVLVSVHFTYSSSHTIEDDTIKQALDYHTLSDHIRQLLGAQRFQLIETAAQHIADFVLEDPRVEDVTVWVNKPGAVVEATSIEVSVYKTKS